jgi:hypothetical protein
LNYTRLNIAQLRAFQRTPRVLWQGSDTELLRIRQDLQQFLCRLLSLVHQKGTDDIDTVPLLFALGGHSETDTWNIEFWEIDLSATVRTVGVLGPATVAALSERMTAIDLEALRAHIERALLAEPVVSDSRAGTPSPVDVIAQLDTLNRFYRRATGMGQYVMLVPT